MCPHISNKKKLEKQEWHVPELGNILIETEPNSIVYLCGHCHGGNCHKEAKCT